MLCCLSVWFVAVRYCLLCWVWLLLFVVMINLFVAVVFVIFELVDAVCFGVVLFSGSLFGWGVVVTLGFLMMTCYVVGVIVLFIFLRF